MSKIGPSEVHSSPLANAVELPVVSHIDGTCFERLPCWMIELLIDTCVLAINPIELTVNARGKQGNRVARVRTNGERSELQGSLDKE